MKKKPHATGKIHPANNLEAIRLAKGLRLEDLAARMEVSISTIQRWEKGAIALPSNRLPAVAEAYGISVRDVFAESAPDTHLSNIIQMWPRIARIDRERAEKAVALFAQTEQTTPSKG